ncbi:hypothetical protein [Nocardia sp. NPDC004722]
MNAESEGFRSFELFDRVTVATDRFARIGVPRGSVCHLIDQYTPTDFELDYSDETGATVITFSATTADLRHA